MSTAIKDPVTFDAAVLAQIAADLTRLADAAEAIAAHLAPVTVTGSGWSRSETEMDLTIPGTDEEGWIEWTGGERPVPGDTLIDARFADSLQSDHVQADVWPWDWWAHQAKERGNNITAYRLSATE